MDKKLSFDPSPAKESTPKTKSRGKISSVGEDIDEAKETVVEFGTPAKPTAIVTPQNKNLDATQSSSSINEPIRKIFQNMKFVLTSANRQRIRKIFNFLQIYYYRKNFSGSNTV